jgi:hypothetical protein
LKDPYTIHKWIGTILFMTAGFALASNFEGSKYGFFAFLIAHTMYVYIFAKTKDWPMVTNNAMFACIDMWGIYRWFF